MNSGEKHRYPHTEREQRVWGADCALRVCSRRGARRRIRPPPRGSARTDFSSNTDRRSGGEQSLLRRKKDLEALVGDRTVEERARVLVTKIANEKERIVSRPRPVKLTNNRATRLLVSIPSGYTVAN